MDHTHGAVTDPVEAFALASSSRGVPEHATAMRTAELFSNAPRHVEAGFVKPGDDPIARFIGDWLAAARRALGVERLGFVRIGEAFTKKLRGVADFHFPARAIPAHAFFG
jgi:hypothetical protein